MVGCSLSGPRNGCALSGKVGKKKREMKGNPWVKKGKVGKEERGKGGNKGGREGLQPFICSRAGIVSRTPSDPKILGCPSPLYKMQSICIFPGGSDQKQSV